MRWLAGLGRCVAETASSRWTLMGVSVDITARRVMQDQIRRQRARLERTSRVDAMAEFSASIAHELSQPLTMILTNAEAAQALLAQPAPNLAEVREIPDDIVSADRRAADLIRHVRSLIERGEPEREALTRLLRAAGLQVRGFSSAREFLAHERPPGPACLVLDLAMPEIDGLEVQERLRRGGAQLPIVFLTGHGSIPLSVRTLKAGAEDFLTKPVNATELLAAIRAALQRAAAQQVESVALKALRERFASLTPRERRCSTMSSLGS